MPTRASFVRGWLLIAQLEQRKINAELNPLEVMKIILDKRIESLEKLLFSVEELEGK